MQKQRKLLAIKARLGPPKQSRPDKDEYGFICPGKPGSGGCTSAPEGKVRLWVNIEYDTFNCWHCGYRNGGSLAQLMVRNSAECKEYKSWIENTQLSKKPQEKPHCFSLPDDFIPFGSKSPVTSQPYINYLHKRGLSDTTVGNYRIGYIDIGKLAGRVVIPSFDEFGSVNFWSARAIYEDAKVSYILPKCSKDIISNEYMVDWKKPVYLVEGIFDEMAIGCQAIALYGKFVQPKLLLRLVENRTPHVYICLDNDAKKEASSLSKQLLQYDIKCSIVNLLNKDPSIAGKEEVFLAAKNSKTITDSISLLRAD